MSGAATARAQTRTIAIRTLVELENSDRPLSAALDDAMQAARAYSRHEETCDGGASRGFALELVAGVCRHRARLDFTLLPLLKRELAKLDAPVRAALRLASLERIVLKTPVHVVANEYAEAMRAARLESAVGFVNAVSRRLPETWHETPEKLRGTAAELACDYSHPLWLTKRWIQRLGFDGARALCAANNEIAPLCLRVNSRCGAREKIVRELTQMELAVHAGEYSPEAIIVERAGAPDAWPQWKNGALIAQDEAAQMVTIFALHGIVPDEKDAPFTALDLCAAPGGKATHLAQVLGENARVLACDSAPGRIKLIEHNAARLDLSVETFCGDARDASTRVALQEKTGGGDLVLLDAPCLGTGTLRRRPDAKWRKNAAQLNELVALQRELLDAAATIVRSGGVLVYSTCSLEPEENEEQARAFLHRHSEYSLDTPQKVPASWRDLVTEGGFLRTSPAQNGCDGAFAARFRRVG